MYFLAIQMMVVNKFEACLGQQWVASKPMRLQNQIISENSTISIYNTCEMNWVNSFAGNGCGPEDLYCTYMAKNRNISGNASTNCIYNVWSKLSDWLFRWFSESRISAIFPGFLATSGPDVGDLNPKSSNVLKSLIYYVCYEWRISFRSAQPKETTPVSQFWTIRGLYLSQSSTNLNHFWRLSCLKAHAVRIYTMCVCIHGADGVIDIPNNVGNTNFARVIYFCGHQRANKMGKCGHRLNNFWRFT